MDATGDILSALGSKTSPSDGILGVGICSWDTILSSTDDIDVSVITFSKLPRTRLKPLHHTSLGSALSTVFATAAAAVDAMSAFSPNVDALILSSAVFAVFTLMRC